ncbi:MAG: hemolysin III family protein [Clostridia bacterium]|nr:hemolysin III family protein [Clostridia bacterium]
MATKHKIRINFYSLGEEIFSSVTHGVGALFSIAALVLMVVFSAIYGNARCVISSVLYGVSLIILYTCSTLYHALTHPTAKKVFRVLDHCTIFLLIAGTYTPITLLTLRHHGGWWVFGFLWGLTVLGIVLNAVSLERFKVFSMICYIVMGWCVVFCAVPFVKNTPLPGVLMILAGGLFYTFGLIFFGSKHKYMHAIWHLFVLAGSIVHFFAILFYILWPQFD